MPRAPFLLAVDTATEVCSVAVCHGARIDELARPVGQRHTEFVLPMVDELLAARGLRLADCEAVAFGAGPGSFTGLRIACGIAQGLAYGLNRPVVPVGNLAALAHGVFLRAPAPARVLVAIDARMHETYWAVYARRPDGVDEIAPPALARAEDLPALARRHAAGAIAGNALVAFAEPLSSFDGLRQPDAVASARDIVVLAREAAGRDAVAAGLAAPLYVRDRVALTVDERRKATAPA
jgi:tRNA threonylcarbamoyladenosine biosynthesis protein TsaB